MYIFEPQPYYKHGSYSTFSVYRLSIKIVVRYALSSKWNPNAKSQDVGMSAKYEPSTNVQSPTDRRSNPAEATTRADATNLGVITL